MSLDFVILHEDIKVVLQTKVVIQEWLHQVGLELKLELTDIATILKLPIIKRHIHAPKLQDLPEDYFMG